MVFRLLIFALFSTSLSAGLLPSYEGFKKGCVKFLATTNRSKKEFTSVSSSLNRLSRSNGIFKLNNDSTYFKCVKSYIDAIKANEDITPFQRDLAVFKQLIDQIPFPYVVTSGQNYDDRSFVMSKIVSEMGNLSTDQQFNDLVTEVQQIDTISRKNEEQLAVGSLKVMAGFTFVIGIIAYACTKFKKAPSTAATGKLIEAAPPLDTIRLH